MIKKLMLLTCTAALLAVKAVAAEIPVSHVKDTIVKQSVEMDIDPALALSLAKAESGYNHTTKSPYGAVGVFQLMPDTARRLGVNPYYLAENIKGGLMYYKMLYKMFGSTELALAAYHSGPAYVLKHKRPAPYSKKYVSAVMADYYWLKAHTDPAVKKHNAERELAQKQAKAKAEAEAKAKAEAKLRAEAEAKAKTEAKLKSETEPKTHSEVQAEEKTQTESEVKVKAETKPVSEISTNVSSDDKQNG